MLNSITVNARKITARHTKPLMNKMPTILLIDDDDIFIFLTKRVLMNTGLVKTIDVCKSAIDAVQFLSSQKNDSIPDMIFLDLNMPGMDGWEFLENYQLLLPELKNPPLLYVISSSIAENDYDRAMNIHGVNGYLSKPLEITQIKTLLQNPVDDYN
jgi:CheY-like chemotaxis protein